MKKMFKLIFKIILMIFLAMMFLDYLFTSAYLYGSKRGKIDSVYNSEPKNYDVVFLGSSRANNHFVPEIFQKHGLKSFNFGMSGSHLFEASLMLKLLLDNKCKINNVILEADLNLSNDKQADGIAARFLPYIHSSAVVRNHFKSSPDFINLYYIPFYRYIKFENRIGIREMFFSVINKKTSHLQNLGYSPLLGEQNRKMSGNLIQLEPLKQNKYFIEIKQLCKKNNINFIPITTPMCENIVGIDYFDRVKLAYPEIYNYESAVQENKYFSSCGHLNDDGARKFTRIILKDFFNK